MSRIVVAGLGRLGTPFAACLAAAGHEVLGYDPFSVDAVVAIKDRVAIHVEEGLQDLLTALPAERLNATQRLADVQEFGAEASFIVVPTPSAESGRFDARHVVSAATALAGCNQPDHTIVVCSTVSPGTMDRYVRPVVQGRPLAYSPQFIALGDVIKGLRHPDLVIIGSDDRVGHTHAQVERILEPLWHDLMRTPRAFPHVARLSLIDAEIAKLAVNAYVTMKISFANMIAEGCEGTAGADALRVLRAIGHDHRIGNKYLLPGGPFGGPCFPRDSDATTLWLRDCGAEHAAGLPLATKSVNGHQYARIARMLDPYHTVAILGLTYKPGTSVTDHSLGVAVRDHLVTCGHGVIQHDPFVQPEGTWTLDEIVAKADAVLVATAHPEYGNLNVQGKPTVDVWGCLTPQPGVRRIGRWVLA